MSAPGLPLVVAVCVLLPAATWATPPEAQASGTPTSAALVVLDPASIDGAALDATRRQLEQRHDLRSEPELRAMLEGEATPLRQAQQALARARQALRRFEMPAARQALTQARERSGELAPSPDAKALVVEISIREAELELVESRPDEVARHLGAALSLEPMLVLDPELYSPPLLQQLELTRARRKKARRVPVRVDTVPSGARVVAEGAERCCTPLTVELTTGWQLLWFHRDRYAPSSLRLLVSSAGPVSVPLTPETSSQRLGPLVDALRSAASADRDATAQALREALEVEVLAVLETPGAPPRLLERPVTQAPAAAFQPASGVEGGQAQGPGFFARRWPVVASAAVATALVAGGAVMGSAASKQARDADGEPFASDGKAEWESGAKKARTANLLYAGAAVAGATGVVLYLVF